MNKELRYHTYRKHTRRGCERFPTTKKLSPTDEYKVVLFYVKIPSV